MAKVLHAEHEEKRSKRAAPIETEPAVIWTLVFGVGIALTVIGWTDLALLWYPLGFGNPEWEFATISGTFDGLPLGTIGIALVAVGATAHGWHVPARVMAVIAALIVLVLIAISVIYLLDVPVALRGTPPEMRGIMKKAMLKAGAFAATYISFYSWLAWFLWRKTALRDV